MKIKHKKKLLLGLLLVSIIVGLLLVGLSKYNEKTLPPGVTVIEKTCQDVNAEGGAGCTPRYYQFENIKWGDKEKLRIACEDVGGRVENTFVGGIVGSQDLCVAK